MLEELCGGPCEEADEPAEAIACARDGKGQWAAE